MIEPDLLKVLFVDFDCSNSWPTWVFQEVPGSPTSLVFHVSIVMRVIKVSSLFQKKIILWKFKIVTADNLPLYAQFFPCF